MKVLLSWSGTRSQAVANALREWLPLLFQTIEPWMSSTSIPTGSRWGHELAGQLESTDCGILCLTPENMTAPWILFEAGALSKSTKSGCVIPYLFDLSPNDLPGPLGQFQAVTADADGTKELARTLSTLSSTNRRTETQLHEVLSQWWPRLESRFAEIPPLARISHHP